MRSLVLLALTALAALPLAAHEHGRSFGRGGMVESSRPAYRYEPRERWEHPARRAWEYRARERREDWERRAWRRGSACQDDRLVVRPGWVAPPFGLGLDIRIR